VWFDRLTILRLWFGRFTTLSLIEGPKEERAGVRGRFSPSPPHYSQQLYFSPPLRGGDQGEGEGLRSPLKGEEE